MENSEETAEMTKGIWFSINVLSTTQMMWDNTQDIMLNETSHFMKRYIQYEFNFEYMYTPCFPHSYITF